MKYSVLVLCLLISGCGGKSFDIFTYMDSKKEPKPSGEWLWTNPDLYSKADNGELTDADLDFEFNTARNTCNIESKKIAVPSPSCTAIPDPACNQPVAYRPLSCSISAAQTNCDYSSVNAAYDARDSVYRSCMNLAGWQKEWHSL